MSVPERMRAFQLVEPRRAELRQVPVVGPGAGDVLLRVAGAGVCHSDLHLLHARALPYDLPMTLGHEVPGHVVATGSQVRGWETGSPALVYLCWGCGTCSSCARGADNYCGAHSHDSAPGPGLGRHGGMAELITVPARHLVALGDLDPVRSAPLADAGLTPYHAVAGARDVLMPGSTAVVIGVGGLGNLAVQVLAATTAARIVAVDTDEERLRLAEERGAHAVLLAGADTAQDVLTMTAGRGAALVLDLVGNADTLATAAACVGAAGRISIVGLAAGRLPVLAGPPPFGLPWGATVVKPYAGTRTDLHEVLALARRGDLEVLVQTYPLEEAEHVLRRLESGTVRGRAVLVP